MSTPFALEKKYLEEIKREVLFAIIKQEFRGRINIGISPEELSRIIEEAREEAWESWKEKKMKLSS